MTMILGRTVVSDVVTHLRSRLAEWVFAAVLAMFGHRLLATGSVFASSPSYAYMASWASEITWGFAITFVATVRLLALTINGSVRAFRPYSPGVRSITAWLSAAVWFSLTFSFYQANPNATGWGTYGVILIADLSLAVTIAHDAGHAYRMRHGYARGS